MITRRFNSYKNAPMCYVANMITPILWFSLSSKSWLFDDCIVTIKPGQSSALHTVRNHGVRHIVHSARLRVSTKLTRNVFIIAITSSEPALFPYTTIV